MNDRSLEALRILRDALDTDPGERDRYLSQQCGDDTDLRERVEAMLRRIGDDVDESPTRDSATATEPTDTLLGEHLGPFRVIERIGRGGMGVVYRGEREDADFAQTVAIKLIRRGFDFDDVQARFLRERRILAKLNHPNLARFIDGGVAHDGRPWFALEYVDGKAITRWCDAERLDVRERVRLFLDVCAAVQYAHGQLVVHRDLKPGNVLVTNDRNVRLLDFGIARLLEGSDEAPATLTTVGSGYALTPEYAAPEQFARAAAGVGADIYALGVILYELVTGVLPYTLDRHDLAAAERTVRDTPPEPPIQAIARNEAGKSDAGERLAARRVSANAYRALVRGDLSRILGKALAKEPERRYASVEAFADDLARWLAGAPVRVSGNGLGYRIGKFIRRNRLATVLGATAAIAVLAGIAGMAWKTHAATVAAERANTMQSFVLGLFRSASPMTTPESLPTTEDLLAEGARQALAEAGIDPETRFDMLATIGTIHLDLRRHAEAMPLLQEALTLGESLYGEDDVRLLPPLLGLLQAETFQVEINNGKPQEASAHLERAQRIVRGAGEARQAEVVLAKCALHQANVRELGNGIAECRAAVAALEHLDNPDPGQLGKAYYLSARTLSLAGGHVDEAIDVALRGLERVGALGGSTAAYDELSLSSQLSNTLKSVNRLEEALARINHANAVSARLFRRPHPDAGKLLYEEAVLLNRLGRVAEAEATYRKALSIYTSVYGERLTLKSADMFWTRAHFSSILVDQRKYDEAESVVRGMIADVQADEDFRKQTRTLAQLDSNLAGVLVATHRLDEAERLIDPIIGTHSVEKSGARFAPILFRIYGLKAQILEERGRPAEAIAWYERGIAAQSDVTSAALGVEGYRVRLGAALREAGRLDEAIAAGTRARDTLADLVGEKHRGTIKARQELALSLERKGLLQEAKSERDAARTAAGAAPEESDPTPP